MDGVAYFRTLFDYNYWARDRLLTAMRGMTEADFASPNRFTYGSIRAILVHCVDTEYSWLCRLMGGSDAGVIPETELATPQLLADRWQHEEARMREYLAQLTEADLATDVVWQGSDGRERRLPNRWLTLAHVVNHSTQHRSEAAEALTMVGRSPGDLDLGLYVRTSGAAAS
jgi:uncharacterized damage-inducible protein DinB